MKAYYLFNIININKTMKYVYTIFLYHRHKKKRKKNCIIFFNIFINPINNSITMVDRVKFVNINLTFIPFT